MPELSKPSPIAGPFAYNGDRNAIPDSTSAVGAASFQQGFPPATQLPVTAGGVPPQRNDFNGILNALSQHIFWLQSGGMYDWSATLDYAVPAMVAGADGKTYMAQQLSGPGTEAGPQNPTKAGSTYWKALDFSGMPPIDGTTIVESNGRLSVNVSASPASGALPVGDAAGHVPVGWIQPASTGQQGVVQLNSAVNSTRTDQAATPSAVKAAYDTAVAAQSISSSGAPRPQLAAGVGQFVGIAGKFNASFTPAALPAGGAWLVWHTDLEYVSYIGIYGAQQCGADILPGGTAVSWIGWAWRIA